MKKRNNTTTRREFVRHSMVSLAAAPILVPSSALGAAGTVAPSERITMGTIGVGGRGTAVMKHFLELDDCQFLAVCDPFAERRIAAQDLVNEFYEKRVCDGYNDFRELLARSDIDAVLIATPDHWHVPQGITAARAGKDMYIEKPLSITLAEGRALSNAVHRYGRVFQFGTQQRSSSQFRQACELVRSGRIGDLCIIEVGSPFSSEVENQPQMPIPDGFDYHLWLGPAPWKPYTEKRCITPYWYFISDYTIGYIAGWGVHHIDIAQWGNGTELTGPIEIEGKGIFPKDGLADTATAWIIEMTFDNGVKCIYADNRKYKQGVRFVGTEGWIHVNRQGIDADPKSILESEIQSDDIRLYRSDHHQRNFVECIKNRHETICPAEVAHRTTSICHLSHIAILLERKLRWNPEQERFVDDPEADRLLSRAMRSPWHL